MREEQIYQIHLELKRVVLGAMHNKLKSTMRKRLTSLINLSNYHAKEVIFPQLVLIFRKTSQAYTCTRLERGAPQGSPEPGAVMRLGLKTRA